MRKGKYLQRPKIFKKGHKCFDHNDFCILQSIADHTTPRVSVCLCFCVCFVIQKPRFFIAYSPASDSRFTESWELIYNRTITNDHAVIPFFSLFFLQQVSAADPDEGAAGDVKYSIIRSDIENHFRLDANSGILYPGLSLLGLNGECA